jgi:hypothetical protein
LRFYADREIKIGDAKGTALLENALTVIIFGDLTSDFPRFTVLVAEEIGDYVERVGCFPSIFEHSIFQDKAMNLHYVQETLFPFRMRRLDFLP